MLVARGDERTAAKISNNNKKVTETRGGNVGRSGAFALDWKVHACCSAYWMPLVRRVNEARTTSTANNKKLEHQCIRVFEASHTSMHAMWTVT